MILSKDAALIFGLFFGVFELLIGGVIGWFAARFAYRSRFTKGLAVRAAVLGGITFVLATILGNWAGDQSPASWLRMHLAEHGLVVALGSSILIPLLAGIRWPATKNQRPT